MSLSYLRTLNFTIRTSTALPGFSQCYQYEKKCVETHASATRLKTAESETATM